jgi:hypothetical protein
MTKRKITPHFYTVSDPECSLQSRFFKPAVAFEVTYGVDGIAGLYQFPRGTLASAFEDAACRIFRSNQYYAMPTEKDFSIRRIKEPSEAAMSVNRNLWNRLVALNPELAVVTPRMDEPMDLHDAIFGAAALLNPTDIQFFIKAKQETGSWQAYGLTMDNPEYRALNDEVTARTGLLGKRDRPHWLAAPETLHEMIRKMDLKL